MKLFDSHFHYYNETTPNEYVKNIFTEVASSPQVELGKVEDILLLAVGASYKESNFAMEFAQNTNNSWFAVGVHPHSADEYLAQKDDFSCFYKKEKLVAIGEIGLDYFYETSDRNNQNQVFEEFLELALKWNLPAIIHCRDKDNCFQSYDDMLKSLMPFAKNNGRFVVHCFAGNSYYAEKILELGGYLGVTGMVTFPKADNIRTTLQAIPLDRLLIETDAPYLAPVPNRGKQNHSGFLIHTASRVAKERNLTIEEIADITTKNAIDFFKVNGGLK